MYNNPNKKIRSQTLLKDNLIQSFCKTISLWLYALSFQYVYERFFFMLALSPKAGANIQRLFRVHTIQIKKNSIFFSPTTQPPILQALTTLKKSKIPSKASAKGLKKEK